MFNGLILGLRWKISIMKSYTLLITLILSLVVPKRTNAQGEFTMYTETGTTIVCDVYFKAAVLAETKIGKFNLGAGIQYDLKNTIRRGLSGYYFNVSRKISIGKFPFKTEVFITQLPFSDYFIETDYGFILNAGFRNFILSSGANFKTFGLSKKGDARGKDNNSTINESWNFMYSFSYCIRPIPSKWNLLFTLNDYDDFTFSQETNPVLNLEAWYQLKSNLNLFIQSGYKSAGVTNTNENFFGIFIKAGIIWKIN